jgi:hypothetical protein
MGLEKRSVFSKFSCGTEDGGTNIHQPLPQSQKGKRDEKRKRKGL